METYLFNERSGFNTTKGIGTHTIKNYLIFLITEFLIRGTTKNLYAGSVTKNPGKGAVFELYFKRKYQFILTNIS